MRQEIKAVGVAAGSSPAGTISGPAFSVLLTLAGSDSLDTGMVADRLGLSEPQCRLTVEDLQRCYLVDIVSRLDGDRIQESVVLTDDGEMALLGSLEQMCELPEFLHR